MVKQGNFLLATQALKDSYFEGSVVFLVEHSDLGTYGLILNKVCPMPINEVFTNAPLYMRGTHHFHIGGPVDENLIQIVHTQPTHIENAKEIQPNIFIGNAFIHEEKHPPGSNLTNEKVFLGYSGWSTGQLKEEIQQGCWDISTIDPSLIFHEYTPFFMSITPETFKKLFNSYDS